MLSLSWPASVFSRPPACISSPAIGCEGAMFELILGGVISVGMFGYLIFALLRPEKF
jgi:K+-transporting ATPase KdpF subunit